MTQPRVRNTGLDFLRIIAIFMVLLVHVMNRGTGVEAASLDTQGGAVLHVLMRFSQCSIDTFGMITGAIFGSGVVRWKPSRIVKLWLQVFCYSFFFTLAVFILRPGRVDVVRLLKSALPVATNQYWYFTQYFALFFFMPFLNKMIDALSERELRRFLLTVLAVLCLLPAIVNLDLFKLVRGTGVAWLAVLYVTGAYLYRYGLPWKPKRRCLYLLGYFLCSAAMVATTPFMNESRVIESLNFHNSPLVFGGAIFLFAYFRDAKITANWAVKVIGILSPAAFGVYLIHDMKLLSSIFLADKFSFLLRLNAPLCLLATLGCAAGIYLICAGIDTVRAWVFKRVGVDKLMQRLDTRIAAKF